MEHTASSQNKPIHIGEFSIFIDDASRSNKNHESREHLSALIKALEAYEFESFANMRYFPRTIHLVSQPMAGFNEQGELLLPDKMLSDVNSADIPALAKSLKEEKTLKPLNRKDYHPGLDSDFIRKHNIIDPRNEDAKEVTAYLKEMMDKILRANGLDPRKENIPIVLYDTPGSAAWHGHVGGRPIIGVNVRELKTTHNADVIAHRISHELTHHLIPHRNSKQQEIAAQAYSLKMIANAGFNPRMPIEELKPRAAAAFKEQSSFDHVMNNDHASSALDVREMENVLAVMERSKGIRYDQKPATALPNWFPQSLNKVPEKSIIPGAIDLPRFHKAYEHADPTQKMKLLRTLLWLNVSDEDLKVIISQALDNLRFDAKNTEQNAAFSQLVERITCCSHENLHAFYDEATLAYLRASGASNQEIDKYEMSLENEKRRQELEKRLGEDHPSIQHGPPFQRIKIGEFIDLDKAIIGFIDAKDKEAALENAKTIVALSEKYSGHRPNYLQMSGFSIPTRQTIQSRIAQTGSCQLPYQKHLKWLKESNDQDLRYALALTGLMSDSYAKAIIEKDCRTKKPVKLPSHGVSWFRFEDNKDENQSYERIKTLLDHVKRNRDGAIIECLDEIQAFQFHSKGEHLKGEARHLESYGDKTLENIIEDEQKFGEDRAAWERKLIATTDWTLLEKDPKKFIRLYHGALEPDPAVTECARPFADRFVKELTARITPKNRTRISHVLKQYCFKSFDDGTPSYRDYKDDILEKYKRAVKNNPHIDEEIQEEEFGTYNPEHPLIQFIVNDPLKLFKEWDRLRFLEKTRILKRDSYEPTRSPRIREDDFHIHPHRLYPKLIMNPKDASALVQSLETMGHTDYDDIVRSSIIERFLSKANPADLTPAILGLCWVETQYGPYHTETKWDVIKATERMVEQKLRSHPTLTELCDFYISCVGLNLLDAKPFCRSEMADRIVKMLDEEPNLQVAEAVIEKLIKKTYMGENIPYTGNPKRDYHRVYGQYDGIISDPKLRNKAITLYADKIARDLGIDTGSESYLNKLNAKVKRIREPLSGQVFGYLLPELAHKIEAQKPAADYLRKTFLKEGMDAIMSEQIAGNCAEFFTYEITKDERARAETIELITHPLDPRSVDNYLHTIRGVANKSGLGRHFYFSSGEICDTARYTVTEFHKNFWAAPLEFRVWYLEKQLFPVQNTHRLHAQIQIDEIVDRVLPLGEAKWSPRTSVTPLANGNYRTLDDALKALESENKFSRASKGKNGFDRKSTEIARTIVRSYLEVLPLREQRLLATTMLVADSAGILNEEPSVGRTLNLVLSRMGPAGAKLLQAIHSHPGTPQKLKEELLEAKTKHDIPFRWDVIDWLDQEGAFDKRSKLALKHVGPIIGSASLGVATKNRTLDGKQVVDTQLRPHAAGQALMEFDNMAKAVERAVAERPELDIVRDMVNEATKSIHLETNIPLSIKQNHTTQQTLDKIEVSVQEAGKTYHFTHSVAPILATGKGLKRTPLIKGEHFIDLPEDTQDQRDYKRAAAKATLLPLLGIRLAALPKEKDRHGGNIKICGQTIGHYDTAAQELEVPTVEQRRALGKVIGVAMNKSFNPMGPQANFEQVMVEEMDKAKEQPEIRAFLAGVKREFLAESDLRSVAGKKDKKLGKKHDLALQPKELLELVAVLVKQHVVDDDVMQGIKAGLGANASMAMFLINTMEPSIHMDGLKKNVVNFKAVKLSQEERELIQPNLEIYRRKTSFAETAKPLEKHTAKLEKASFSKAKGGISLEEIRAFCKSDEWVKATTDDLGGNKRLPVIMGHYLRTRNLMGDAEDQVHCDTPTEFLLRMHETCDSLKRGHMAALAYGNSPAVLMQSDCPKSWPLYCQFAKAHGAEISDATNDRPDDEPPGLPPGGHAAKLLQKMRRDIGR